MSADPTPDKISRHLKMVEPSAWFSRYQPLIKKGGTVLDVAAGSGRHARFFADQGHHVTVVDRNVEPLKALGESHGCEVIQADLEDGSRWPLEGRSFDAVIVCNYLNRPLFVSLINSLAPNGVFLYETFALGNEVYNRPRNPDHLLKSGELLNYVAGKLQVISYQHGILQGDECPGVKQMICAVNNLDQTTREDGEPKPFDL